MFAHQKYKKKQSKAIKTKTRTYILQQVSNISKRQCSPTRNIKKKQGKAIKTRTRTYILQQVSNISKRQCSSTRNIKSRVKQLRLEHAHTFYNKCPTYLKGNTCCRMYVRVLVLIALPCFFFIFLVGEHCLLDMLDTCCRMYVRVLVLIALLCFFLYFWWANTVF